jgi:DNA repair protein RadC
MDNRPMDRVPSTPAFGGRQLNDTVRQRLDRFDPKTLSDAELLAVVLAGRSSGEPADVIAHRIMRVYHDGFGPRCCSVDAFRELCQVGRQHACQTLACFELGRRFYSQTDGLQLCTPDAVYDHVRSMVRLTREAFRGLYVDVKNCLIHDEVISLGTLSMNLVHPREVFRPAIEHSAAGIILTHNHPSGDPTPSAEDLKVTHQLTEVGRLLDIEVLDHVIVARRGYISLRRKGILVHE